MAEQASRSGVSPDKAKLSARLAIAAFIISLGLELVSVLCGPVYEWEGLDIYSLAALPFGFATLFSALALVYASMLKSAAVEDEERRLLEKRKEGQNSILSVSEDVRFTAGRTLGNYEKYGPATVSLLCFLAIVPILYLIWRNWGLRVSAPQPKNPLNVAFVSALCMGIAVFPGAFLVGQSKVREFRWLRPVGAWLVAGFAVMLLASASALLIKFGIYGWERAFARTVFAVLCLLGAEFLISFVTEFYRPRTQIEDRPVFESRLLALFTEPGGVIRNVAETLDYQFGFKVSKTWIYNLVEMAIAPALAAWLVALWLFTGIYEVKPGELGIRERLGALVDGGKALSTGVHFKLPWPLERIVRVPVDKIQELMLVADVEGAGDAKRVRPATILWTSQHYAKEGGFLVANEKLGDNGTTPVSILDAALPLQYKAKPERIYDYAFKFENIEKTLKSVGEREATRYFASTDFMKAMSSSRELVAKDLKGLIQKAADGLDLGVDIVCVNFHDAHPPVEEVAPAFEDVLCAQEEREAKILAGEAAKTGILADAKIKGMQIVQSAESYKYKVVTVSAAEAERFTRQLVAYKAMPTMFKLRSYLEFLENDCRDRRKFIVPADMPYQIYELNLEEKALTDIIDADLSELSTK